MLSVDWTITVTKKHVRYDVECDAHTLHFTVRHDRALAYINADLWCVCMRALADAEIHLAKTIDWQPPQLTALTDKPDHKPQLVRIHDPPP